MRPAGLCGGALCALLAAAGLAEGESMKVEKGKPPIMLVAFGSTVPETRQTFARIEADVKQAFPDRKIVWAFTSEIVRERLKEQGESVAGIQEALDALARDGFTEVILQSLHIMPGEEYQALYLLDPRGMKLWTGAPLLGDRRDREEVRDILASQYRSDRPNVIAAHGNAKRPQLNEPLEGLAAMIESTRDDVVLATIDGPPGTKSFAKIADRVARAGGVHFVPLMLISGIHVRDDLVGEGHESWKRQLGAREASVSPALGDMPEIRAMLVRHIREAKPVGDRTGSLMTSGGGGGGSSFDKWKRRLPFWPRKLVTFLILALIIIAGVFIGQALEELNLVRFLGVLVRPVTSLGRLPSETATPFIFSFQSGAMANSMLVNLRDNGILDARGLYTSVFVVSSFSLFAHLPTYIVPLGMAFGWAATGALFGVRLAAIVAQVIAVLVVARFLTRRAVGVPAAAGTPAAADRTASPQEPPAGTFWARVAGRSWKTTRRLLIYLVPTFFLTAWLEQSGFFTWLTAQAPWLFKVGGLPSESAAVIGAQAVNLYNGAIMAASFTDSGAITIRQAVLILLAGTILTAPIRTLKHSMSTYIAVLGLRPGVTMAVATQVTRSVFLLVFTVMLALVWK